MNDGIEKYVSRRMKLRILHGLTPRWMLDHIRGAYIIASTLAAPLWVHRRDLRFLCEERRQVTADTGVPHVLDHIVPITHPFVCGLTVSWNLQCVPKHVNAAKNNQWHPDQLPLLSHDEALRATRVTRQTLQPGLARSPTEPPRSTEQYALQL